MAKKDFGECFTFNAHDLASEDIQQDCKPIIEAVSIALDIMNREANADLLALNNFNGSVVSAMVLYGLFKTHYEQERRNASCHCPPAEKAEILSHYSKDVRRILSQWESYHSGANKEEWYYALLTINWMVSCGQAGGENSNG